MVKILIDEADVRFFANRLHLDDLQGEETLHNSHDTHLNFCTKALNPSTSVYYQLFGALNSLKF